MKPSTHSPPELSGDEELIRRIAGGEKQAFRELYQLYSKSVYNYLLRLLNEPDAAEDILQEVFIVVWQDAGRFRGQAKVRTWIYRIAHHRAVSWLRRRRPTFLSSEVEDHYPEHDPEQVAESIWEQHLVQTALGRLSPKHREVLELVFVQGMAYSEIAEVIGCPVGTVKSRMSYALRAVTDLLKNDVGH